MSPASTTSTRSAHSSARSTGPLNVVLGLGTSTLTVGDLQSVGVTRISLGGSIARAALGLVRRAAQELLTTGTIDFAADQIPQAELNELFARTAG